MYARKEYDEQNKFCYPFINNLISNTDGTIAQKHKRLVVRSGGSDNGFGYIRSELIAELASQSGFPDVMHSEPVCVYINGIYRGIYWIENTFDDQYFENRYGKYEGEFIVLQGGDTKKEDESWTTQKYVDEYNEMYHKFAAMDLTDDENYEKLCNILDVENYLSYFAIQNYVGNKDWPNNNVKVYRYVADEYTNGTVFDGRYRHLLFDTDYGMGLMLEKGNVGIQAYEYTLERIMGEDAPLFAALMKREECRNYFVNFSLDLMNGVMREINVSQVLAKKHASRNEELRYMLEKTDIQKDSLWFWEGEYMENYETVETEYREILEFAEERGGTVLVDMILTFDFGFELAYELNVNKGSCFSQIQINSNCISQESFTGTYVGNVPIVLTPIVAENEIFEHWLVNGAVREEKTLVLSATDIVEAQINVEMITKSKEEPVLQILAVRAKGLSDFIEIVNMSDKPISSKGYYLTDNDSNKYLLPSIYFNPGERKRFYGKDCMDIEGLGQYGLNFNLKEGETVSLIYGEKIIESLYIPDLSYGSIYQRNGIGDNFVEEFID